MINRISLNKGETVTLYVFGKASGAFDNISVGISASKIPAKTVPVENPQVGEDAESYTYGCATAQGNNNFYYVYAPVSGGVPDYTSRGQLTLATGSPAAANTAGWFPRRWRTVIRGISRTGTTSCPPPPTAWASSSGRLRRAATAWRPCCPAAMPR